jgi:hypothetical protein
MFCFKCRKLNTDDSSHCVYCGASLNGAVHITETERSLFENLTKEKEYRALSLVSDVIGFIGKLLIALSVVWAIILLIGLVAESFYSDVLPLGISQISTAILLIPPFVAFFAGIIWIAIAELIRLFIDLQRNADRQSIIMTLILRSIY